MGRLRLPSQAFSEDSNILRGCVISYEGRIHLHAFSQRKADLGFSVKVRFQELDEESKALVVVYQELHVMCVLRSLSLVTLKSGCSRPSVAPCFGMILSPIPPSCLLPMEAQPTGCISDSSRQGWEDPLLPPFA